MVQKAQGRDRGLKTPVDSPPGAGPHILPIDPLVWELQPAVTADNVLTSEEVAYHTAATAVDRESPGLDSTDSESSGQHLGAGATALQAKMLLLKAFDSEDVALRTELARQALAACPDCADAHLLLGDLAITELVL